VLVWLSVCSKVQIACMWSSWCHCIPKPNHLLPHLNPDWSYLSGTGLPRLSRKKGRLNGLVVVVIKRNKNKTWRDMNESSVSCALLITKRTRQINKPRPAAAARYNTTNVMHVSSTGYGIKLRFIQPYNHSSFVICSAEMRFEYDATSSSSSPSSSF